LVGFRSLCPPWSPNRGHSRVGIDLPLVAAAIRTPIPTHPPAPTPGVDVGRLKNLGDPTGELLRGDTLGCRASRKSSCQPA